jgi:c(7)-type cytochrome triheme protein
VSWSGRSVARACTFRAEVRGLRVALAIALLSTASCALAQWPTLKKDGIHDPKSAAVEVLQQPKEALSKLPRDSAGNMVNWVRAIETGAIQPRATVLPNTQVRVLESDILLNLKGGLPMVRFPHRAHTLWLDCSNCHDQLFKPQAGANRISMLAILEGEQCGVCHGAVAFPLTECNRCHNTPRQGTAAR